MPYLQLGDLQLFYLINPDFISPICRTPTSGALDPACGTLVFLHAGTLSSDIFEPQMRDARLRAAYDLVFFDARCHGKSTAAEREKLEIKDVVEALVQALDMLDIHQFTLLGEGVMGCNSAIQLAFQRPKSVQGLLLASPSWIREKPHIRESLQTLLRLSLRNKEGNAEGDGSGTLPAEILEAALDSFVGTQPRLRSTRDDVARRWQERYGTGQDSHDWQHAVLIPVARDPPPAELLAKINVPVLLLHGDEDKLVSPVQACQEWRKALSGVPGGAHIYTVAEGPHLLSLTDGNIVSRIIHAFMERQVCGNEGQAHQWSVL